MFDVLGKVALVTGGASGIGFEIVKELFRNGLKGCTIADINKTCGRDAVKHINEEFGQNKAIFIQTDVVDKSEFEAAFEATIKQFNNVDILVNNAGILNDSIWERQLLINVQSVVTGILLGMENYLQKFRNGTESVILNVSSVCGIVPASSLPIYCSSKHAVVGFTRTFGAVPHYQRTKVKVLAICPGVTNTVMLTDVKTLAPVYTDMFHNEKSQENDQSPEFVAQAAVHVIKNGSPGSVWIVEAADPYEVIFRTRQEMRKT